ncbi:hypothetical protein [Pseudomonas citronellolis]|uniref:hypothetical protein n=1 Tax=Pseudomonas citronellolis TaxID=53408 RepID=UPI002D766C02|nr:hypothetical protein [Pseudomonas citronellolis]WRT81707.1 hypothetical protein VK748_25195 [Pseudomonas citronellolis]WRT81719.1 hypothetical protein VK748_25255 [Pseudomonas citronellolis]
MPYVYLGATRDAGTSKKTGRPYDICQVWFAVDAAASTRPDRKGAYGVEPMSIELAPEAFSKFQGIEPLTAVNFDFEPNPSNMQRNRVVGVRPVPASVKQAS